MSWAISNNVPSSNLHKVSDVERRKYGRIEVPYARRYITMALIEHVNGDLTQEPDIVLDPLSEDLGADVQEITEWMQSLLRRINREVSERNLGLSSSKF